jgi:NAD-dependent DNA ligase
MGNKQQWRKGRRREVGLDSIRTREMMMMIPSVGNELAYQLELRFGSWQNLLVASRDDLELVTGIGPCLAAKIWDSIHDGGMEDTLRRAKTHQRWELLHRIKPKSEWGDGSRVPWRPVGRYDSVEEAKAERDRLAWRVEFQGHEFATADRVGSL